jgi:uncharacterized protein
VPRWAFAIFVVLVLSLASTARAAFEPPRISGYVTDPGGKLTPEAVRRFDEKLAAYRKCSTNHVVVFIASSLDGSTIEDAAGATFKAWKPGDAKKDNGVLLMIAPEERKVRIEVGRGLEGQLTDLQSNDILRQQVSPHLKANAFDEAVDDGTTAIGAALGGACTMPRVSIAPIATVPTTYDAAPPPPPPTTKPTVSVDPPPKNDHVAERLGLSVVIGALVVIAGIALRQKAWFVAFIFAVAFFAVTGLGDFDIDTARVGFAVLASILGIVDIVVWVKRSALTSSWPGSSDGGGSSSDSTSGSSSLDTSSSSSTTSSFDSSSSSSSSTDTSYSGGGGTSGGGGSSDSY